MQQTPQRDDGLAESVRAVLVQILDAQVTEQLQAGRYEPTAARQGYRNVVRPRRLTTRVGPLKLQVSQV